MSDARYNKSIDTDVLSAGFARLLSAGHLQRYVAMAAIVVCCAPSFSAGKPTVLEAALTCTPRAGASARSTDCPYLSDILKTDKAFRAEFQRVLRSGKIPTLSGPEGPVVPLSIGGEKYLAGNRCQAHNCSDHRVDFLYSVRTKAISGTYLSTDGKRTWFGNPTTLEKQKLTELTGG